FAQGHGGLIIRRLLTQTGATIKRYRRAQIHQLFNAIDEFSVNSLYSPSFTHAFIVHDYASFFTVFLAGAFFLAGALRGALASVACSHLPSRYSAVQPVALPSFSVITYCSFVLRRKRNTVLLPLSSVTGASAIYAS